MTSLKYPIFLILFIGLLFSSQALSVPTSSVSVGNLQKDKFLGSLELYNGTYISALLITNKPDSLSKDAYVAVGEDKLEIKFYEVCEHVWRNLENIDQIIDAAAQPVDLHIITRMKCYENSVIVGIPDDKSPYRAPIPCVINMYDYHIVTECFIRILYFLGFNKVYIIPITLKVTKISPFLMVIIIIPCVAYCILYAAIIPMACINLIFASKHKLAAPQIMKTFFWYALLPFFGIHWYMNKRWILGTIYLLTVGGLGVWALVDGFTLFTLGRDYVHESKIDF